MTTEENIVFQLLETIRASELNSDEVIDEREIRSHIRTHRATLIEKYSNNGMVIQEVCFQRCNAIRDNDLGLQEFTMTVPNIINLPYFYGVRLFSKSYFAIPVTSEEKYYLSKENILNKYQPKANLQGQTLQVYAGSVSPNVWSDGISMTNIINEIKNEDLVLSAVLSNPDDGIGYNWTTSKFPFPEEMIQELKKNILRQEFNIILQTKSDQVPNMKNDTLRYHDQGKINQ